ncbi:MAG: VTT domain-containing protein [Caldilineaceae bacterium]
MLLGQRETWFALIILLGVALLFWLLSEPLIYLLRQGDMARAWIYSFGPQAPLAYITLFALQILVAPVPGQFLGIMSGFVFGFFWGALYSITGLIIGAGIAIALTRRYGRPLLERFVEREQLRVWERKLYMRSPVSWALLFLFPVPDFVFYLAGLSSMPVIRLFPAIIVGRGLGLIIATTIGGLTAHMPPEWVIVKWAALVVLALLLYRRERRLRLYFLLGLRKFEHFLRRWQKTSRIWLFKLSRPQRHDEDFTLPDVAQE